MIYRVIGTMNNKNLDGLSIIFVEFTETGGKWNIEVIAAETYAYTDHWMRNLKNLEDISILQFQLLHASFGQYIGDQINNFINQFNLHHKVHLISSNGHTVFTVDKYPVNLQLGSGASIAATTQLPVVSDLLSIDIALGGNGSILSSINDKLLMPDLNFGADNETLIIAFMGILRWREEANMMAASTGAKQNSIGGALWLGNEA